MAGSSLHPSPRPGRETSSNLCLERVSAHKNGPDSGGTLGTIAPVSSNLERQVLPQNSEDEISFLYLTVGSTSSHLTELSFGLADRLTSKSATKPNATKSVGNSPNPIAVARYRLNVGNALE